MNKSRVLLILFFILLSLLYLVSSHQTLHRQGVIAKISSFDQITIMTLEEFDEEVVLFGRESLPLRVGDHISFEGVKKRYQGREQIEVRKLFLNTPSSSR